MTMKKILICYFCYMMGIGITTAKALDSSGSFSLYSNSPYAEDNTAEELEPENAPVDGGAIILLSMAAIYAYRIYRKSKTEIQSN